MEETTKQRLRLERVVRKVYDDVNVLFFGNNYRQLDEFIGANLFLYKQDNLIGVFHAKKLTKNSNIGIIRLLTRELQYLFDNHGLHNGYVTNVNQFIKIFNIEGERIRQEKIRKRVEERRRIKRQKEKERLQKKLQKEQDKKRKEQEKRGENPESAFQKYLSANPDLIHSVFKTILQDEYINIPYSNSRYDMYSTFGRDFYEIEREMERRRDRDERRYRASQMEMILRDCPPSSIYIDNDEIVE